MAHFVPAAGTNIVDIPIIMKDTTTRSIPVNCKFDSTSVREATINIPIFVSLNIIQNWEAKNINTSREEKPFR